MKGYLLLLLFAASLFAGCDNREEYFKINSLPPTIGLVRGDQMYSNLKDSVKVIRPEQQYYPIELKMGSQNSEINSLQFRITKGKGHIEFRKEVVTSNNLPSEYESIVVKYVPETLGEHQIAFTATNRFGAKAEMVTTVLFFSNFPPKAQFELTEIASGQREYIFDGSASIAGDAKFGGYLAKYIYSINGEQYELKSPKMNYIFPSAGDYEIKLTVIDGDGIRNEVSKTIKIEK